MKNKWKPQQGLCNHAGAPLVDSKTFPWDPPPEIGEVLSADTNVSVSGSPSLLVRFVVAFAICVATYLAVGEGLLMVVNGKGNPTVVRCMAAGLGVFAGFLWLAWKWPPAPHCTYVGTEGAAYLTGKWGRANPANSQVLLFREAAVLFNSTTHFYKNLMYQNTLFRFDWHADANTRPLLTIGGEHSCKDALPDPDHLFHFAMTVEEIWTNELMTRLDSDFTAGGTLSFPCRKSNLTNVMLRLEHPNDVQEIRLSKSQVQFVYGARAESVPIRDFSSLQLHRGVLKLQRDDPTWFSRQGRFRIDYQHLGNARAFLHYLSMAVAAQQV
jgi:hypothetical protein